MLKLTPPSAAEFTVAALHSEKFPDEQFASFQFYFQFLDRLLGRGSSHRIRRPSGC